MNVRNITLGAYGGLAGGVVFGAMMAMMGMLPMIGMMVGVPSAGVGFLVHLVISALIGISFAVLFDRFLGSVSSGLALGLIYGGAGMAQQHPKCFPAWWVTSSTVPSWEPAMFG